MTSVAVIAHTAKELGGGLPELRQVLAEEGVTDPLWREVSKSKQVPKRARDVLERGADVIFVWGGDGTVQRCADSLAGTGATLAILPAGTANLLATNLGVPKDIREAVRIGLHGERRPLDLGVMNGEHFAVMAGVGLDALMIRDAPAGLKDRFGRMAYVVAGAKHLRAKPMRVRVRVNDAKWFTGKASCILFGNVGKVLGGITVFQDARAGRRHPRSRRPHGEGLRTVGPRGRSNGDGSARPVPVRTNHPRRCLRHHAGSEGAVRARWGRPQAAQTVLGEGGAGRDPGRRPSGAEGEASMSSANDVPETYGLSGDDAWETLRSAGRLRLIRDAFKRLRAADGFSHARSTAFISELVLVQGIIALVGLASLLHRGGFSDVIVRTLKEAAPGPAGEVLTKAVTQAHQAGHGHTLALTLGVIGALISGTTLMGQMERAMNRLYGIERDRPTIRKYGRAFVMALSAGILIAVAFVAIAFGRQVAASLDSDLAVRIWEAARWPVALVLLAAAVAAIFRWAPNRHQPQWSWLAFGATISVGLWIGVTALLAWFFSISTTFGETYGPLAGIVALLLWALLSSIAVLFGGAIAAQLEAVRAGDPAPQLDQDLRDTSAGRAP